MLGTGKNNEGHFGISALGDKGPCPDTNKEIKIKIDTVDAH